MIKELLASCLILSAACRAAKLVIVRGAPCAGKSSICRELAKRDSSWCAISVDSVRCVLLEEMCQEHCPDQTAIVKRCVFQSDSFSHDHFSHAIRWRNVVYKDDVSVEMQGKVLQAIDEIRRHFDTNEVSLAREAIEERAFDQVKLLLEQGKNVILESWLYSDKLLSLKDRFPTRVVLAYCPPKPSFERLVTRSCVEQGAPAPRYYYTLMWAFLSQFRVAQSDKQYVDSFDIYHMNELFGRIEKRIQGRPVVENGSFTRNEFDQESLQALRGRFMEKYSPSGKKLVLVASKADCDVVLRTNRLSLAQCVKQILDSF